MSQIASEATENQIHPEIAEMFKAGVHFGYRKTKRHPNMRSFIFGTKNNVEVFDLAKVYSKMEEALAFVKKLGEEGKAILLVGTKASAREAIKATAERLGMPYVSERWLGGTLTNFKVLSDRVAHWLGLEHMKISGEIKKYTKQEQVRISKEITKLDRTFGGLRLLKKLPAAVLVVDISEERIAVAEARKRKVPVIAISSSDTNPDLASYPIPANDNSKSSIAYLLMRIEAAYREGAELRVASQAANTEA
jgi:small subunit ribosomal protein S2